MTIGRFAPSPTGPLHLGSLVAALSSYLLAKASGGEWLLRMEDLDTPRILAGAADDILRTLELLGLHWDREVVFQRDRIDVYQAALDELIRCGAAYPCACSRADVARTASAPHAGSEGPIYPGTCRQGIAAGRSVRAYRVRVDSEPIGFEDGIQGPFCQDLARSVGDFVVKRADGPFAYQLAVVVDDDASGVTQVVRGADLLSSTPRQIRLQSLLKFPTPAYFHIPLVSGPGGEKLSKRECAVSLAQGDNLRKSAGKLWVQCLRFLGQSPPPSLDGAPAAEVRRWALEHFDVARVPRGSAPLFPPPAAPYCPHSDGSEAIDIDTG